MYIILTTVHNTNSNYCYGIHIYNDGATMRKSDILLISKALMIWALIVGVGFMSTLAFNSLLVAIMITAMGVGLWCLTRNCKFYCKLETI